MVRKKASGALLSARKHAIIKDMQAAIAREMAAQSEVPKVVNVAETSRQDPAGKVERAVANALAAGKLGGALPEWVPSLSISRGVWRS
jgi:hypothetical protein